MLRLIVAGTRRATEEHLPLIGEVLLPICRRDLGVLAHGGAPGVDRLAADLAATWGWTPHPMPARWSECDLTVPAELGGCPDWPHRKTRRDGSGYCPYAGPRRNQWLVDLSPRADHVLVFPAGSIEARSGTRDLWQRAARAGFQPQVHPLEVGHG